MLNYMKALPIRHRNAIENVSVMWISMDHHNAKHAFTALKACENLQHLAVDITVLGGYFRTPGANSVHRARGFMELTALRGLKSFKLTYGLDGTHWNLIYFILNDVRQIPITGRNEDNVQIEIMELESQISELVTLERAPGLLSDSELNEAFSYSNLVDPNTISMGILGQETTSTLELLETNPTSDGVVVLPQAIFDQEFNDPPDVWDLEVPLQIPAHRRILLSSLDFFSFIKGRALSLYNIVRS
jgi:hypothetical protein